MNVNPFDPQALISSMGAFAVIGVAAVIFVETATILGSILPGDSLLFILGLSLATYLRSFPIFPAIAIVLVAAMAGAQVGFWLGRRIGAAVLSRKPTWYFNPIVVDRAALLLHRYGSRAIILSRFVPVVRALVPLLVGIGPMTARRYALLNVAGGLAWVVVLMTLGYLLGGLPYVQHNFEWFVWGFVALSSLPLPIEILMARARGRSRKSTSQ